MNITIIVNINFGHLLLQLGLRRRRRRRFLIGQLDLVLLELLANQISFCHDVVQLDIINIDQLMLKQDYNYDNH